MIGLFFVNIGAVFIGGLIVWYVINKWVLKDD